MKISLHLYASLGVRLPEHATGNSCIMEIHDGKRVQEVLDEMDIPADYPKIIFLNGRHAQGEEILHEGDRLAVFPPIAGG
jgi:sulfur-carrier protein